MIKKSTSGASDQDVVPLTTETKTRVAFHVCEFLFDLLCFEISPGTSLF